MEKQLRGAIEAGNLEDVKRIVRDNNLIGRINTIADDSDHMTPLHHACWKGDVRISTYLVDNCQADVNVKDIYGFTPLHYACVNDHSEMVLWLIKNTKLNDDTAGYVLQWACRGGHLDIVTFLVTTGRVDVNCKDRRGETPLHKACKGGHLDIVTLLVTTGRVDVNCKDVDERTPLHEACAKGDVRIATYLVDNCQADVNVEDIYGYTPLHDACLSGKLYLVSYLIETHKCNAQITANDGSTPLHLACKSGNLDLVSYLIETHKCNVQITADDGSTPLHLACKSGNLDLVSYLIETHKCNAQITADDGSTPLHLACTSGRLDVVQYMVTKTNCDVNARDKDGNTPLDVARQWRCHEVVSFLEEHLGIKSDSSEPQSETIPSGHILTREELQVLGALLSRFSDEKLKSIQLSLQEEEAIGHITREEVEKSLRQSGLASMADALKDDIEKGITNMKRYEAYKQALKGGLALTLRYLKFLFFGPPRSGKTSTRRRLLKEIINLAQLGVPSISTGVAETNDVIIKTSKPENITTMKLTSEPEDVTIKKMTCESVAVAGIEWKSMKSSKEGTQVDIYDEEDLARLFYQLFHKQSASTTPVTSNEPTPMQDSNKHSKSQAPDPSNPAILPTSRSNAIGENMKQDEQSENVTEVERLARLSDKEKSEISDSFATLTTILQSDSPEDLKRLLEDLTMINMADVGGQPAFLDMLPALTIGPALYLLFFRLDQKLGKKYPVRFHAADSKHEITLESSYCIEEVLYQCLASIACFSSQQRAERDEAKPQASGHALLFGTYKDRVTVNQISEIESTMEERFKGTELHQEGLLLKLHGKMVTTVNNMFGTDEPEMSDIRTGITKIIEKKFQSTPIPLSWLMFRIVLHLLKKPIVSLAQCEEIAKQLSMTSPVQEAIWFFHHNIGSLMHYTDIRSMEDTIICNPQVIFDSVSKLIIERFQSENLALKPREVYEFQQKGLFTLSHIQNTTDHHQSSLLEPNQLVDVLKHHNILAEVKQDEEVTSSSEPEPEPKFIMPAVMKYASEDELLSPSSTIEAMPSPIFIHFAGGFVPFGVFCAGVARLIAQLDSMSPRWQLCPHNPVMRNKAKFIIDGAFYATLVSRPQYIMVHIEQHPRARCKTTLEVICSKVRKTVVQTLETVVLNMKYKPYGILQGSTKQPFELAFTCNLEDSHSDHIMIVTKDDSGYHAKCLESRVDFDLEDKHLIWFKDEQNINSGPHASSSTLKGYTCPICREVLRDPYQATCCGMNFCNECIHRVKAANEPCPMCRKKDFDLFQDKRLQRDLYNSRVDCTNKSKGCEWTGELRELDNHLNSDTSALEGCPYTLIKCPLGCAEYIYRKDVKDHAGRAHAMAGGVKGHAGGDRRAHVSAGGKYYEKAHAGDGAKFISQRHHSEMKQSAPTGLSRQTMTKLGSIVDVKSVASKPCFLQPQQPVTGTYKPAQFTMNHFEEYKRDNGTWYSPHFYTHPNGYKMCLRVDANGSVSGQDTHLSVFVCLMQGKFDDQLEWPFQGNITIQLVNQEEDRDHVIKTFYSSSAGERCERVTTKERINSGWGIGKFLSHAELQPKYLKNNCIKLYIKKILIKIS